MVKEMLAMISKNLTISRARTFGFTLVELLVVVAIVSLLIALVVPSLRGTVAKARTSGCASNLRQQGIAMMSYSADNDGKLTPSFWTSGSVSKSWVTLLIEGGYAEAGRVASATAPIRKGSSIFSCPEGLTDTWSQNGTAGVINYLAKTPEDPITFRPWRTGGIDIWYGLHAWSTTTTRHQLNTLPSYVRPVWAYNEATPGGIWPNRLFVTQPSRKVFILDANMPSGQRYPHSGFYTASARHNNKKDSNVLLHDGHVETVNFYEGVHRNSTKFLWQVGDYVGPH